MLDVDEVECDEMRAGVHEHLGRERVVLRETRAPCAAVDVDVNRGITPLGCEYIQFFEFARPVREALRLAEPPAHELAVRREAREDLLAVRRVHRLIVGVVERLLVVVQVDAHGFHDVSLNCGGSASTTGLARVAT